MLWRKERRDTKRYKVSWEALLEVQFHDFQGKMPATVVNFSGVGVLLNSKQILINGRHLTAADYPPELNLKIFLSEGVFESKAEIRWYDWSVEKDVFEIGVKFINLSKETQQWINKLIKQLSSHYTLDFHIFKRLFSRNKTTLVH